MVSFIIVFGEEIWFRILRFWVGYKLFLFGNSCVIKVELEVVNILKENIENFWYILDFGNGVMFYLMNIVVWRNLDLLLL